jgi:hypothetical protein
MFKGHRAIAGLLLCMVAAPGFARTEVWFGPHPTSVDYYTAFEPARLAEWQALSYSVDVFKFYLTKFTPDFNHALEPQANYFTQAQVQQAALTLHQVGMKAAFEMVGPMGNCQNGDPATVGYTAAVGQAGTLQIYIAAYRQVTGRTDDGIHALAIDGPVEATHFDGREPNCTFSNEQSLQAYVSYVVELRNRFPQAQIGIITNFANMTYDGKAVYTPTYMANWNYRDALTQMVTRASAAGVAINFLQIDHPADLIVNFTPGVLPTTPPSTRGNWGQLRDVANQARSLGLRVNVIFNTDNGLHWHHSSPFPFLSQTTNKYSAPAPVTQAMRTTNRLYATNSLNFAARWRDEGMPIDIATFQSWHNYPYSVFQSSAPQLGGTPSYDKYAAANIVNAVNTIFNRSICSPYDYKAQRSDLDAYFSQFSGPTLYANTNAHWNVDGAFELIGVSSDPFALHPRLDPNGSPVAPTQLTLCRTTPPDTCTEAEYFRRRPDVGAAYRPIKQSAMFHWQHHGQYEGMCQPSRVQENCSIASYFLQRPDVQADSGGNNGYAPYHWGLAGRWEGMCRPL